MITMKRRLISVAELSFWLHQSGIMKALYPMQFSYLQVKKGPELPGQKPDSAARHAR